MVWYGVVATGRGGLPERAKARPRSADRGRGAAGDCVGRGNQDILQTF